jgi:pimeloyl-ACP methyl ester carboxylesterase
MRVGAWLVSFVLPVHLWAQPLAGWMDPSPHTVRLIQVESGTTVEVLDWGGPGRALVLLAQLGQTAHIYDDWAPKLARSYRVLGITRRGYGESATPADANLSTERLADDIVAVIDALTVPSPVLVGHAFAGEEMSWVGSRHPDRLAGLVFVDAAYDRRGIAAEAAIMRRIPGGARPMRPEDMASASALTRWMSAGLGFPIPESDVRQTARFGPDGRVLGERTPAAVQQRVIAGIMPVDYATIRVPALAIYAKRGATEVAPGCRNPADDPVRQACGELYDWTSQQLARSEAMVKTIPATTEIVELAGASAFAFLSHEREVTRAIDRFVGALR